VRRDPVRLPPKVTIATAFTSKTKPVLQGFFDSGGGGFDLREEPLTRATITMSCLDAAIALGTSGEVRLNRLSGSA
jgi:hypothetical protein